MARLGRCTNFGNCTKPQSQEAISVPDGADFVCPECGSALREFSQSTSNRTALGAAAVAAVLVVAGLLWIRSGPKEEPPKAVSRGPAASAVQPTPAAGPPPTVPPAPAAEVVLRLHGSNTIGDKLAPALAERFLAAEGATEIRR